MDFFSNFLVFINNPEVLWAGLAVLIFVGLLIVITVRNPAVMAEFASGILQPFLVSIDTSESDRSGIRELKDKLDLLNLKIDSIRSEVSPGSPRDESVEGGADGSSEGIADSMERTLRGGGDDFQRILWGWEKPRANRSDVIQQLILNRLSESAKDKVALPTEKLSEMLCEAVESETKWGQQRRLDTVLSEQLASAGSIRRAMLNLFVLVNIILIASIILKAEDVLSNKEIILGLYVSFSTFIVYVYRSSNARALILMAGIEDSKRYHDADKYLQVIAGRGPNDRDIEALKILLINRMEREKNSEHPYELVLKGISNSNILMKGGKISATEVKDKASSK